MFWYKRIVVGDLFHFYSSHSTQMVLVFLYVSNFQLLIFPFITLYQFRFYNYLMFGFKYFSLNNTIVALKSQSQFGLPLMKRKFNLIERVYSFANVKKYAFLIRLAVYVAQDNKVAAKSYLFLLIASLVFLVTIH